MTRLPQGTLHAEGGLDNALVNPVVPNESEHQGDWQAKTSLCEGRNLDRGSQLKFTAIHVQLKVDRPLADVSVQVKMTKNTYTLTHIYTGVNARSSALTYFSCRSSFGHVSQRWTASREHS